MSFIRVSNTVKRHKASEINTESIPEGISGQLCGPVHENNWTASQVSDMHGDVNSLSEDSGFQQTIGSISTQGIGTKVCTKLLQHKFYCKIATHEAASISAEH